ncbi:hypothetical protein TURU_103873 [Turdus rufiventris]|nr:hypothetical protein TURU_103873 [Turdus rufiventris]
MTLWDQVSYRKFADDKKLSGGVDMTKGWDAIQTELDKLSKWMHVKLMRFSNAKDTAILKPVPVDLFNIINDAICLISVGFFAHSNRE